MKKLIIALTILSFLNLIGCHYQEQMNPGDYTFDENSTIKITTKDTVYNFNGDDYQDLISVADNYPLGYRVYIYFGSDQPDSLPDMIYYYEHRLSWCRGRSSRVPRYRRWHRDTAWDLVAQRCRPATQWCRNR